MGLFPKENVNDCTLADCYYPESYGSPWCIQAAVSMVKLLIMTRKALNLWTRRLAKILAEGRSSSRPFVLCPACVLSLVFWGFFLSPVKKNRPFAYREWALASVSSVWLRLGWPIQQFKRVFVVTLTGASLLWCQVHQWRRTFVDLNKKNSAPYSLIDISSSTPRRSDIELPFPSPISSACRLWH